MKRVSTPRPKTTARRVGLLSILVAFGCAHVNAAATRTWVQSPANNLWSTAGNWGGTAPVSGDSVTFNASNTTTLSNDISGLSLGTITFNPGASAFSLGGNAITLTGNIFNFSTSLQSIGFDIALSNASGSGIFDSEYGDIELSGVISGGTTNPFIKNGSGTVTMDGVNPNTYTVGTNIGRGTLALDLSHMTTPTNLINGSSALTLGYGAATNPGLPAGNASVTLSMKGAATGASSQSFNGTVIANASNTSTRATISIDPNGGAGTTLQLGAITRNAGSVLNFTLPSNAFATTTSGSANGILASGVAAIYATVNGNDWAAKDATNTNIVGLSTVGGYTASTGTYAFRQCRHFQRNQYLIERGYHDDHQPSL